jgi:hypothetical protein
MRVEVRGREVVVVADYQLWSRTPSLDWKQTFDDGRGLAIYYALYMRNILPVQSFPSDVRCLGELSDEGRLYKAYEYPRTEYKYLHGEEGEKGIIRTMLVDPVTGLPHKFEDREPNGSWRKTVRWYFDPGLNVEAPVSASQK